MIPFGSQRGNGGELAIHLENAHDNEYVEIADIRGAISQDLSGAFAEWEAEAYAMTNARKYLYSLSINPDPRQPALTREQYQDYIARVEKSLGLEGQPRALVYHIKGDREHLHSVWSRIDLNQFMAIPIAFDRHKLMMITCEFANDHGIKLPPGYELYAQEQYTKRDQLSLYEKRQQETTGITKEQRIADVTEAWSQSDGPKAFLRALEDKGYILAMGKRPYVLVDRYGHINSLPKLIDDKSVRTKDIRAFLEGVVSEDDLPTVAEAQEAVKAHQRVIKEHEHTTKRQGQREELKTKQQERRAQVEADIEEKKAQLATERDRSLAQQAKERADARSTYLNQMRAIKAEREANKPTGLPAFLGRVTGIELVRKKLHRHQDKQRMDAYQADKQQMIARQDKARRQEEYRQRMSLIEQQRRLNSLDQLEAREYQSIQTQELQAARIEARQRGLTPEPKPQLALTPPGRRAAPAKAKSRFTGSSTKEKQLPRIKARKPDPTGLKKLRDTYQRAAEQKAREDSGKGKSSSGGNGAGTVKPKPVQPTEDGKLEKPLKKVKPNPAENQKGFNENGPRRVDRTQSARSVKPNPDTARVSNQDANQSDNTKSTKGNGSEKQNIKPPIKQTFTDDEYHRESERLREAFQRAASDSPNGGGTGSGPVAEHWSGPKPGGSSSGPRRG